MLVKLFGRNDLVLLINLLICAIIYLVKDIGLQVFRRYAICALNIMRNGTRNFYYFLGKTALKLF